MASHFHFMSSIIPCVCVSIYVSHMDPLSSLLYFMKLLHAFYIVRRLRKIAKSDY